MQILNDEGRRVLGGAFTVDEEKRLCGSLDVTDEISFDLPPVEASFEKHPDGLLVHLLIPDSGLGQLNVLIEPKDMKSLREVPGKGLVGFVLKAFR